MVRISGAHTNAEVFLDAEELGDGAHEQLQTLVDHPAFRQPVRVMPDAHWGKGSVIGFTMPLGERVVPNTIGVDIGCGLYAIDLGGDIDIDHDRLDQQLRAKIPMGSSVRSESDYSLDSFPFEETTSILREFEEAYGRSLVDGAYDESYFSSLCRRVGVGERRAINSIGTLGGGNHFIEFGRSHRTDHVWAVVHSGSRGLGYNVAQHWQSRATELMDRREIDVEAEIERIRAEYDGKEIERQIDALHERIADRDRNVTLDYLEGEEADGYFRDMIFAQQYAAENRREMARQIEAIIGREAVDSIESVHNYIDFRDIIIRKGAVRSYENERLLLPYNMRDGICICVGKSNADYNYSAPHGAGRVMSRRKAFRELDMDTFTSQMDDIYSTSVSDDTLDEAPGAYKDTALIENAIEPTAEIVDRLSVIHNLKAT